MELTETEIELIAGFLLMHWSQFVAFADDVVNPSTLHRVAEKLCIDNNVSA